MADAEPEHANNQPPQLNLSVAVDSQYPYRVYGRRHDKPPSSRPAFLWVTANSFARPPSAENGPCSDNLNAGNCLRQLQSQFTPPQHDELPMKCALDRRRIALYTVNGGNRSRHRSSACLTMEGFRRTIPRVVYFRVAIRHRTRDGGNLDALSPDPDLHLKAPQAASGGRLLATPRRRMYRHSPTSIRDRPCRRDSSVPIQ